MPAPLPPHPKNPNLQEKRINFLPSPRPTQRPAPGGRPTDTNIIQLEAEFDPFNGEGSWDFYRYPTNVSFKDWDQFRRFLIPILKKEFPSLDDHRLEEIFDYLHNFKVLNLDLSNGEIYPVVPRPTGYSTPLTAAC